MTKKRQLPSGWDLKRVQDVIDYYDPQTNDERQAEIEAARSAKNITMMAVPTELVPTVALIKASVSV